MANGEHVDLIMKGPIVWNDWRKDNFHVKPDLNGADLSQAGYCIADLSGIKLDRAYLQKANLKHAELAGAVLFSAELDDSDLEGADLRNANLNYTILDEASLLQANLAGASLVEARLEGTDLRGANLTDADLRGINLRNASLHRTDLSGANLGNADLSGARFGATKLNKAIIGGAFLNETVFIDVDLNEALDIESCCHIGPSAVDQRTLVRSRNVPLKFWRGCGLPERLINYLPSLVEDAIQFYSCFISYSSKDQDFADRLHADLQNNGVRCWFAPHDLPIGKKILDSLDEAIRLRERVVLILSEDAIASDWVEDEVTTAFEEERRRKEAILFPIRLDNAVMETDEAWASKLRARNIGDFTKWKEHDAYKATFERVLRGLRARR